MKINEPMLAEPLMPSGMHHTDENIFSQMQLCFEIDPSPRIATLKLDGIRGLRMKRNEIPTLVSRTFKLIPNIEIRERSIVMPSGFDCELWAPEYEYNQVESIVMSREHALSHTIQFNVLDWITIGVYHERLATVRASMSGMPDYVKMIEPVWCSTAEELFKFFIKCEAEEGEGICFRLPLSPYKSGRSTFNQQYLIKVTRYVYEEAIIMGFEEQMENGNSEKRHATGKMNRSSGGGKMYGKNTLGALVCRTGGGVIIKIGTGEGLTDAKRHYIWTHQSEWMNKQITFKHKPHGKKDKPRSPILVGERKKGY